VFGRERIEYKTPEQVALMRRAGIVVADALEALREAARPGLTTADLDVIAATVIGDAGATASFLGYEGFPATVCISINDEVVHGIPGRRVLHDGDLVSIDCGAIVDGWHADAALSFVLGDGDPADHALVDVTHDALWAGIAALAYRDGRVGDVGDAVEHTVEAARLAGGFAYGIVEDYVGHGIGTAMHMAPDVRHRRPRGPLALLARGPRLVPGMVLAVEPMLTLGDPETHELDDGWTAVTDDGGWACHWEHTVALTPAGLWVLTAHDGGEAALTALGAPFGPLD
jgi:methionyl aminopeptidase